MQEIASYIDHTVLKPDLTYLDIRRVCEEAITYNFKAVCVPPKYVQLAKLLLSTSQVRIATVIGFPLGYNTIETKTIEILQAIKDGADEFDIVHDISALKSDDWETLRESSELLLNPLKKAGKTSKIILETGLLTHDEIINCCHIYTALQVDFLKTSTGFTEKGASVEVVSIMRKYLPSTISIKASGGIRSFAFAKELIDAGATRIGTSSGLAIVKEAKEM